MKRIFAFVLCLLVSLAAGCTAGTADLSPTPTVAVPQPTAETLDALRVQLNSGEGISRVSTIAKLEQNGSAEAVAILGEFFMNADVTERYNAARALVRLNTPEAQQYIRAAMADKPLTARRQTAMQALEANDEAAYPFLQTLLRDADETVRLNTVQVIQFIGTAQARTLLQIALRDASPAVQQAAKNALEGLGFAPSPTP